MPSQKLLISHPRRCQGLCRKDSQLISRVVAEVLSLYDGMPSYWRPPPTPHLQLISTGGRSAVLAARFGSQRCCVKLYYASLFRTKLRALLGLGRARRAYLNGIKAAERGIRCPEAFAYAIVRPFGPSLLVTELLEGALQAREWIAQNGLTSEFVRQFAVFLRRMHDAGISHVDMQLRNVMVRPRPSVNPLRPEYEFILVDLEDIRLHRHVSWQRRIANLYHINRSGELNSLPVHWRLEFFKHYAGDDNPNRWLKKVA